MSVVVQLVLCIIYCCTLAFLFEKGGGRRATRGLLNSAYESYSVDHQAHGRLQSGGMDEGKIVHLATN